MALTAGSICAGIGGLERLLPVDVRWHAEMDPHASKVLKRHWPGVPNLGDIKDVDWGVVEPVDVILGGPPCQPISNAGKRRGTEDERWLWPWVWGAVRALRPRYVFLENPGAVAGWLGDVLGGLAEIGGYEARWNCLRASEVGAPHHRSRWFLLVADATRKRFTHQSDGCYPLRLPVGALDRAGYRNRSRTLAQGVGELGGGSEILASAPYASGGELQRRGERRDMAGSALEDQGAGDQWEWDGDASGDRCAAPADAASEQREPRYSDGDGAVPSSRHGFAAHAPSPAWGVYEPAVRRWEALTRPAPAAVDGRGRLSPAFVEWMMGFPAAWTDGLKRNQALKCLGNAVVSQQARVAWDLLWAEARQGVR